MGFLYKVLAIISTILFIGISDGDTALVLLGSVESKTYLYDISSLSWTSAKSSCEGQGFELATIESVGQHNFLVSKFPILGNNNYYWTGGRDKQSLGQYRWDKVLNSNIGAFSNSQFTMDSIKSALAFRPLNTTHSVVVGSTITAAVRFLCQTVKGRTYSFE